MAKAIPLPVIFTLVVGWGLLVAPIMVFASKLEVVSVTSTGYGPSKETAVRDALTNAVGQVNGLSISTASRISQMQLSVSNTSDLSQESSTLLASERSSSSGTEVDGYVSSYQVSKLRRDPDDPMLYMAEVRAQIKRLTEQNQSNRKRLAIMPIKANLQLGDGQGFEDVSDVQRLLDAALENHLVQTRKFMVLSRTDLPEIANEWALMSSSATSQLETLKIGNLAGADYLVLPELLRADFYTERKYVQATGQIVERSNASVAANIKVLSVLTGEIKFSKSVALESAQPKADRLLLEELALKLVDHMVQQIYPSLIVSAPRDGTYVINAGGDAVQVGDRYEVFKQGEAISDPYTGEIIGHAESRIGELEVTNVNSKFSYGRSVDDSEFSVGMLLRLLADNETDEGAYSDEPKTKGVRLPF